ncbi:MAG TPA: FliM/FliN family flagellar motor switch protein [Solirubrobacteraceae bacterium]|nr:FliM/FliN family flagellar motor switch protein [Solirubrobacteraceae bacterium]
MTSDEALVRIGESTGAAVAGTLEAYCPEAVATRAPVVLESEEDPLAGVPLPAVVADVSYVDGVTGGNLFLMPLPAARALAAAMMGVDPAAADADPHSELTELELAAAGEVANQMMAAAAAAASTVLGQQVEIAAPATRVIATAAEARVQQDGATSVVSVSIDLLGHACRLVQLVPHAFVVRMTRALDDLDAEFSGVEKVAQGGTHGSREPAAVGPHLLGGIAVRVAAELGRANVTIRRAVTLAPGAVVELDRELEDPIELYVNGRRFATGRLVTLDGGEWAVSIDTVAFEAAPPKGG